VKVGGEFVTGVLSRFYHVYEFFNYFVKPQFFYHLIFLVCWDFGEISGLEVEELE